MAYIDMAYIMSAEELKHKGKIGYPYLKAHKDKWIKFSYETGSIDFALTPEPRWVVDDVVYEVKRQYLIKENDNDTTRLLCMYPINVDCELYIPDYDKLSAGDSTRVRGFYEGKVEKDPTVPYARP